MEIIVKGEAKEIAALVLAVQERRKEEKPISVTFNVPECNPGDLIKEILSEGKPIANVNRIIKTEDIPCDNSGNLIFTPIDKFN